MATITVNPRISASNKRPGAYLIFQALRGGAYSSGALIRGFTVYI